MGCGPDGKGYLRINAIERLPPVRKRQYLLAMGPDFMSDDAMDWIHPAPSLFENSINAFAGDFANEVTGRTRPLENSEIYGAEAKRVTGRNLVAVPLRRPE